MKVEDSSLPARSEPRPDADFETDSGDSAASRPDGGTVHQVEVYAEIRFPDDSKEIIDIEVEELNDPARLERNDRHGHHHEEDCGGEHPYLVEVDVDTRKVKVEAGKYVVSTFKALVGVAADRLLDRVLGPGKFQELADDQTIIVCEGEVFISHVKQGSSS